MKQQKTTFGIIVALLVVSLGGLVALQYTLLKDSIRQKEDSFRQNVLAAMNVVAEKLETHEATGKVFKVIVNAHSGDPMHVVHVNLDTLVERKNDHDSIMMLAGLEFTQRPVWFSDDTIRYELEHPQRVRLRVYNAVGTEDRVLVDTFKKAGVYSIPVRESKYARGEYFYKLLLDSATYTLRIANGNDAGLFQGGVTYEKKKQLVGKVIEDLAVGEREPIEHRIQPEILDSLIKNSLNARGISLPYSFGVLGERNDSLKIIQPALYSKELLSSEFKSRLFPGDFFSSGNQLAIFFPDKQMFLLKQIGFQLTLTIILTSLLVFCFAYAVRTIMRQKEFYARLIEFINNMTHEFKTPISTISVAVETITRQDVVEQKEKVLRYGAVIKDENQRMKTQVDKILQMAVLEEGDFELKMIGIDVHDVLSTAVENIRLHVDAKQGTIRSRLEANNHVINADTVHLSNIIHNVLDNANKYTPELPEITVSTKNENEMLLLQIKDNGIGIGKEELKKVFDKYYRVPTGNRHDVKGFGLGLSYVKLMMVAHGGDVSIISEPGKGTSVTLKFSLLNNSRV